MRTKSANGVPARAKVLAQRRLAHFAFAVSAGLMVGFMTPACLRGEDAKTPQGKGAVAPAAKAEGAKPNFDKVGPQVGDQLPNLNLRTMKGESQRLSDAWRGGPALLVTSSLTCPKSRSRWPELK